MTLITSYSDSQILYPQTWRQFKSTLGNRAFPLTSWGHEKTVVAMSSKMKFRAYPIQGGGGDLNEPWGVPERIEEHWMKDDPCGA